MFCRNCGTELNSDAKTCTSCGATFPDGTKFCQNCGGETDSEASFCVTCGSTLKKSGEKKKWIAALLAFFFGGFGVHNFYLGRQKMAIIQLSISVAGILLSCITFGVSAILPTAVSLWALVEMVMILTGNIKDGDGNALG